MKSFDIHLTNVNGLGAKKFVSELLNHLLVSDSIFVEKVYASPELETQIIYCHQNLYTNLI